MSFNIGDKVWIAYGRTESALITCPDCLGNKCLTVIMGDGSSHIIDCVCCHAGYDGSRGKIESLQFRAAAREESLYSITQNNGTLEYNHQKSDDVFATEAEALARAEQFRAQHEQYEANRMRWKHDNNRTWAWNASYHRRELKRAKHNVEYHTAMLDVAKKHTAEGQAKV